jgi:hypothetical protein
LRLNEKKSQLMKAERREEDARRKARDIVANGRIVPEDEVPKGYYRIIATSNYQLD